MEDYLKRSSEFYDDLERDYNDRMTGEGEYAENNADPFEEEWWEIKDRRNNELQDI